MAAAFFRFLRQPSRPNAPRLFLIIYGFLVPGWPVIGFTFPFVDQLSLFVPFGFVW